MTASDATSDADKLGCLCHQVRGGAKSLVIDLGVLLEGQNTWELPEQLLGAVR